MLRYVRIYVCIHFYTYVYKYNIHISSNVTIAVINKHKETGNSLVYVRRIHAYYACGNYARIILGIMMGQNN